MAGLLDPRNGDGTWVENRPSKASQLWGIAEPYVMGPWNAWKGLMDADLDTLLYDTGPKGQQAVENAFNVAGTVTGGSSVVPKPDDALNMGIKAFHGSPHDFDRFSLDKIGTGEGAQAYGHGLYFAENEGVAGAYRDALRRMNDEITFDGQPLKRPRDFTEIQTRLENDEGDWRLYKAVEEITSRQGGLDERLTDIRNWYRNQPEMLAAIDRAEKRMTLNANPGRMYEVEIDADPNAFLDWDKPLSEQPEAVRKALEANLPEYKTRNIAGVPHVFANNRMIEVNDPSLTGRDAYILSRMGQPGDLTREQAASASSALREAGIPGIKYLDAGSRGAGDGTRNYVVFDDNLINIIRKYGIAGLLGGSAAMDAMMSEPQEQY